MTKVYAKKGMLFMSKYTVVFTMFNLNVFFDKF